MHNASRGRPESIMNVQFTSYVQGQTQCSGIFRILNSKCVASQNGPRHTLKILQQMLQDFKSVSYNFGTLCIEGLIHFLYTIRR